MTNDILREGRLHRQKQWENSFDRILWMSWSSDIPGTEEFSATARAWLIRFSESLNQNSIACDSWLKCFAWTLTNHFDVNEIEANLIN